ncbi:MAG: ORF6N domain-containing protein [Bacilli bacterium]|nr:ORF6N domain-containing protein [Bacilli bacterium]
MEKKNEIMILNEENIEDLIYEIRGQKVMLDFDLARIYGYSTSSFNQQVKNNAKKFDDDFLFRLSLEEMAAISKSRKMATSFQTKGIRGGRATMPLAFTEQGIYMLMTVLKGDLAVRQSKALIRLFKAMKDHFLSNPYLVSRTEFESLSKDFALEKARIGVIESKLDVMMDRFQDPANFKQFVILGGERIEADLAYQSIYASAKTNIILIDDYINVKTLRHLKSCKPGVTVTIISDNVAKDGISQTDIDDFLKDAGIALVTLPSNNQVHDRYIALDYGNKEESIYLCGSSSKDSGSKATSIIKVADPIFFHRIIDPLLK